MLDTTLPASHEKRKKKSASLYWKLPRSPIWKTTEKGFITLINQLTQSYCNRQIYKKNSLILLQMGLFILWFNKTSSSTSAFWINSFRQRGTADTWKWSCTITQEPKLLHYSVLCWKHPTETICISIMQQSAPQAVAGLEWRKQIYALSYQLHFFDH